MKNLKVGRRLALAFGLVTVMIGGAALFAAQLIVGLTDEMGALAERRLPIVVTGGKLQAALLQSARVTRNMLILDDRTKVLGEVDTNKGLIKERAEYLAFLEANVKAPAILEKLAATKITRGAYLPLEAEYMDMVVAGKMVEAKTYLLDKMRPAQLAYLRDLGIFIDAETKLAQQDSLGSVKQAKTGLLWVFAVIAASLLATVAVAILSARSITRPLADAVAVSTEIAHGNLRSIIKVDRRDELGTLMQSMQTMQGHLAGLVKGIQGNASDVASVSTELAATAEQVSVATNQQSEAAASMAASVEEMTVSVTHITDSARSASDKTAETSRLSQSGSQIVSRTGDEVREIAAGIERSAELVKELQAHSKEISTITMVVKNISEQTNLLALNAAIEAARAGEEGRGFAVVADAVRELAERTARSNGEIASIVDKIQSSTGRVFEEMNLSVARAKSGLSLSTEAGEAIESASRGTAEVLVAAKEISSALLEQSQASEDIARNVESIAQMAQENSSAVEQTKQSAQTLQKLAGQLQASVMAFSV